MPLSPEVLRRSATPLALGMALWVAGCSEPETTAPSAEPVAEAAAAKPVEPNEAKPAIAPPEPRPAAKQVAASEYKPPFPERTNLFEPPREAPRAAKRGGDSSDSVVLMGFADLGEPLAVLAIDGVVTPLAGGKESAGVRVISIAPPKAVLQRGRSRWTASIE